MSYLQAFKLPFTVTETTTVGLPSGLSKQTVADGLDWKSPLSYKTDSPHVTLYFATVTFGLSPKNVHRQFRLILVVSYGNEYATSENPLPPVFEYVVPQGAEQHAHPGNRTIMCTPQQSNAMCCRLYQLCIFLCQFLQCSRSRSKT